MQKNNSDPIITAVSSSEKYSFSKPNRESIRLIAGYGVEGDVHAGKTVKHRYMMKKDPTQPNFCQVHLIHAELHDELNGQGFDVAAGQMGENITTRGIDLLGLPTGAKLRLGPDAVIEITGLRTPCHQLNDFQAGLMAAVLDRDQEGNLIRKAGVMSIVLADGVVQAGDSINIELPPQPHQPLGPV